MSKLSHRDVLLGKTEATYNTDPVPVQATNSILTETLNWSLAGVRMNPRPAIRPSLGQLAHQFGGTLITLTFACELKGSGAAGTAPEIDSLLLACGLSDTIVAATSCTYAPSSDTPNHKSVTLYLYEDGLLFKVTGARGTVAFDLEVGKAPKANFTFHGHLAGPTDVALAVPVYNSTVPPIFVNAAFAIGGFAGIISSIKFDMKNTVAMPPSVAASDGFGAVQLTTRDPSGSIDPESDSVANQDFYGKFTAGTVMALDSGTIGSVAGNKVRLQCPAISYRTIAPGDRSGIRTRALGFGAAESGGVIDNEFTLVFT